MASVPTAGKRWTLDSLERSLRKALETSKVKIEALPDSFCADVTLESRPRIRVDDHKIGLRTAVIHELLHVVLDNELEAFSSEIEECLIVALENAVDSKIANSPRRVKWWREKIGLKTSRR